MCKPGDRLACSGDRKEAMALGVSQSYEEKDEAILKVQTIMGWESKAAGARSEWSPPVHNQEAEP